MGSMLHTDRAGERRISRLPTPLSRWTTSQRRWRRCKHTGTSRRAAASGTMDSGTCFVRDPDGNRVELTTPLQPAAEQPGGG